jgi:hypothetical protein
LADCLPACRFSLPFPVNMNLLIRLTITCNVKSLKLLLAITHTEELNKMLTTIYRYGRHKRVQFSDYLICLLTTENRYYYPNGRGSFYGELKNKYRSENLGLEVRKPSSSLAEPINPLLTADEMEELRLQQEILELERKEKKFQNTASFLCVLLAAFPHLSNAFTAISSREMLDERYWLIINPDNVLQI